MGAPRGRLRLRERQRLSGALHTTGERIGGRGEVALRGNRRGVGVLRVLFGPFRLAALQIFSVFGERRELTLERRALEQLLAALELAAQLLLRFGETLQRLPRCFRIETRERLLQLAQPLLELRREGALQ